MLGFNAISASAISARQTGVEGEANIAFSLEGVLLGAGSLAGASTVTFSPEGTLTGIGTVNITGATTVTFSPSGDMIFSIAVLASSNITFSISGTMQALTYVWTNADGLKIVFGTYEGKPYPEFIRPATSGKAGKLFYDTKRQRRII